MLERPHNNLVLVLMDHPPGLISPYAATYVGVDPVPLTHLTQATAYDFALAVFISGFNPVIVPHDPLRLCAGGIDA